MNKILMGAFGAVVVSVGGIVAESIRELAIQPDCAGDRQRGGRCRGLCQPGLC